MRRTTVRMTAWTGAILILSACAVAQDFTQKPKSPSPNELPGKQLIVWTATQKPKPLPVTSPQTNQASSQTQTLTGTILAYGPDLLFAGADRANYRIENQEELRAFAGQKVRITGNMDQATRSLYVVNIEKL